MKVKVAKLPWVFDAEGQENGFEEIYDASGKRIRINAVNGEFIVRAVNGVKELKTACEAYVDFLQRKIDSGRFEYAESQLRNQCLNALLKLEGI